jgi:hypothetical protein
MLKNDNAAAAYRPSLATVVGEALALLLGFACFCLVMGMADSIDAWIIAGG